MRREKGKGKMKNNWKWSVERKGENSIKATERERNEN
jgi:hypothetical protein